MGTAEEEEATIEIVLLVGVLDLGCVVDGKRGPVCVCVLFGTRCRGEGVVPAKGWDERMGGTLWRGDASGGTSWHAGRCGHGLAGAFVLRFV